MSIHHASLGSQFVGGGGGGETGLSSGELENLFPRQSAVSVIKHTLASWAAGVDAAIDNGAVRLVLDERILAALKLG